MSDDKPIDAAAVEAIVSDAIRRARQSALAGWSSIGRALKWSVEPVSLSVVYSILAGSFAPDWFANDWMSFLAATAGAGLGTALIHRYVDWRAVISKARAKTLVATSYVNSRAIIPLAKVTAPVREHKATRWTVAILIFLCTRLAIGLRWLASIAVRLLEWTGKFIEALFEGFGYLLKGFGAILGGLLLFAIWALVLLGVIGILVFGLGQIF